MAELSVVRKGISPLRASVTYRVGRDKHKEEGGTEEVGADARV